MFKITDINMSNLVNYYYFNVCCHENETYKGITILHVAVQ